MYLLPYARQVVTGQSLTLMFCITSGGAYGAAFQNPITGAVDTDIAVTLIAPGGAPVVLPISGANFRELGDGAYEYDLDGSNLVTPGTYGIQFEYASGGPSNYFYTINLQVAAGPTATYFDYGMLAQKDVGITISFLAFKDGLPVSGLVAGDVGFIYAPPHAAPTIGTIPPSDFTELGTGMYEITVDGSFLGEVGIYGIVLFSLTAQFTTFIITIQVQAQDPLVDILRQVAGLGTVVLSEAYGGTIPDPTPLLIVSGGVPLAGVRFYIFTQADWNAGNKDIVAYAKGIGESDQVGNWKWPILVEPGGYVLVADVTSQPLYQLQEIKQFTAASPIPTPQPSIVAITPATGPEAGGTLVTITGTNFVDGCTVSFGVMPSGSISFISATMLKVIAPPGTGPQDLKVENPDFTFAQVLGGFTYA